MKYVSLYKTIIFSSTLVNIINCYSCCNTKPEDGKKYIQKALGIKGSDFIEVKEFSKAEDLNTYARNANTDKASYEVVLQILNFDKELKNEEIKDLDNIIDLSKKTTFYYAIIKENVQLKVNSDLLEKFKDGEELAQKFSKTINNNKTLALMIVGPKGGREERYFCK